MGLKRTEPVFWDNGEKTAGGRSTVRVVTSSGGIGTPYTSEDLDTAQAEGSGWELSGKAVQGTLFNPHTGTGTRWDPLTSFEDRESAARRRYSIPDGPQGSRIVDDIVNSSIPTHELAGQGTMLASHSSTPRITGAPDTDPGARLTVSEGTNVPSGASGVYSSKQHMATVLPIADSDTTIHEIGHGEHLRGANGLGLKRKSPDPLLEGVADGFVDRYGNRYDFSPMDNSVVGSGSATQIGEPTIRHHHLSSPNQSYGTGYEGVMLHGRPSPGWETDTERALYAAARQHVATSGKPPSRNYQYEQQMEGVVARPSFSGDTSEEKKVADTHTHVLGRLIHENPEVMEMFKQVGPEHKDEWVRMRNAASDALSQYRTDVHAGDSEYGRRPKGPEAGWMASDMGIRRHNRAMEAWTLPLIDPETGKQFDNTVPYSDEEGFPEHPLPRIETQQTDPRRS